MAEIIKIVCSPRLEHGAWEDFRVVFKDFQYCSKLVDSSRPVCGALPTMNSNESNKVQTNGREKRLVGV